MWGRCNHQALGARKGEFGSPLVAEQDWPSGLGDEEKKVGSHAPKKNNGWLAGGRRKRVGGVLVCVLTLPFDGSVCRVLLLAKGLFSFVRAPCCRRWGSSSPSAATLPSPAHAPGSAALFPTGSGARLAAKKFGVLWGRMAPKKRRKSPIGERLRSGRPGGSRSVRRAFLCTWSVIIGCYRSFGGSGVVPVASLPLGAQSRARPPAALRYAKKLGKKKMGLCVWCGVPRRALLQPSL